MGETLSRGTITDSVLVNHSTNQSLVPLSLSCLVDLLALTPMTIAAFINLKGGCGKSTSAVHLCRFLLEKGKTVALIDSDSQASATSWIENLEEGIPRPRIFRIAEPDPLLDEIPGLGRTFDVVVIDGAGGLAEVQRTILLLADVVLIPVQPTVLDIAASAEAIAAVRRARPIRKHDLQAYTFLTRTMPNTLLLQEAREILSQYADVPLLKTDIPHRQVGADIMGQNLTLFDSSDRAAKYLASCYENLFKEVHFG